MRTDSEIRKLDEAHERGMGDKVPAVVGGGGHSLPRGDATMDEMKAHVWEHLLGLMDFEPVSIIYMDLDELLEIPCAIQPCTSGCEPAEFTMRQMLERLR